MASKLEDVPLFADSSVLGSSKPSTSAQTTVKSGATSLEDIPLNSEVKKSQIWLHHMLVECQL
jgi:hypothetical protein